MRTPDASGPVRTCVGCRRSRPVEALVRLTQSVDGVVVGGPSDGRGAWLCRDETDRRRVDQACVARAVRQRGFARAWRVTVDHADEENIREHTAAFIDERPAVSGDRGRTH